MEQEYKYKSRPIPDFEAFSKAFPCGIPRGFGKINLANDILWGRNTEDILLRRVIVPVYTEDKEEDEANYDIQ